MGFFKRIIVNCVAFITPYALSRKMRMFKTSVRSNRLNKFLKRKCKHYGKSNTIIDPLSIKGEKYFSFGDNIKVGYGSRIEAWDYHNGVSFVPEIVIGNNVSFGDFCHIGSISRIIIDDDVLIGSRVTIIDHNHGNNKTLEEMNAPPNKRVLYSNGPIIIQKNVWIGENVTILGGVTIGSNSVIGCNSVVTHDVPPNSIVGGIPAKIIREV